MKTIQKVIAGLTFLLMFGALVYAQEETMTNKEISHQVSIFIDNGNKVALRALDLSNEKSNYKLKVFNDKDEVVYRTLYSKKNGVVDAFDLSELPKGNYEFVLFNKQEPVYSKCVTKLSAPTSESTNEALAVELTEVIETVYVKK